MYPLYNHNQRLYKLEDKINKQQEQMSEDFEYINERLNRHLELFECMTQVSQDIATKVVDIEKRVDEPESLLDFYSQMIERNRISIADIEYQLKNSDFNGN